MSAVAPLDPSQASSTGSLPSRRRAADTAYSTILTHSNSTQEEEQQEEKERQGKDQWGYRQRPRK
jgi:hypothetical protein